MIIINQKDDGTGGFQNENGGDLVNFNYTETASTAANLTNYGITDIASTAAKSYVLDAPVKGAIKELVMSAATTTINTVVCGSTINGISVGGSATTRKLTFNAINEAVTLRGLSATKWLVVNNTGGVGVASS